MGIKHATYKKLANFMQKKYIYVNRLESVIAKGDYDLRCFVIKIIK